MLFHMLFNEVTVIQLLLSSFLVSSVYFWFYLCLKQINWCYLTDASENIRWKMGSHL
jgi:hypothetical protein